MLTLAPVKRELEFLPFQGPPDAAKAFSGAGGINRRNFDGAGDRTVLGERQQRRGFFYIAQGNETEKRIFNELPNDDFEGIRDVAKVKGQLGADTMSGN